jgi:predicted dithiol-disulfide oxidoreductase (DUF899 family)
MVQLSDRSLPDADPAYRSARLSLLRAETELREATERVAALRRSLPPGPVVRAYELREGPADLAADVMGPGMSVDLPDLLGTHDTLVVYHLMFWPDGGCPMCSMWLDGLDGVAAHLDQHVALAVTAPVPLRQLRDWGVARGWRRLRLVSCLGSGLAEDFGASDGSGDQMPSVSVFTRAVGAGGREAVRHRWTGQAELVDGGRGIDALSPVWNVLDLTPSGRPDWWPGNDYPVEWRDGRPDVGSP